MKDTDYLITNKDEHPNFLLSSLMWQGSVTPRIIPILLLLCCYPVLLVVLDHYWRPLPSLDVTPLEYTGVVLGMVLVFRTNSGYERWWEARKLWGGITNQIRNLVVGGLNYGPHDSAWQEAFVKWAISFAFATKESLRNGNDFTPLVGVLTEQ